MKSSWKYIGQGPCFAQGTSRLQRPRRLLGVAGAALVAALAVACSSGGTAQTGKVQRATTAPTFNDAARFLEQATFGPTAADIQHVQDLGSFDAWIDEQFGLPINNDYPNVCCDGSVSGVTCNTSYACEAGDVHIWPVNRPGTCINACQRDNYTMWYLQNVFFQNALGAPDQLRQRVFFALNQILVTSGQDAMVDRANQMTPYLRMLEENAFGNFRDILYNLSRTATMGRYLDNIDNNAQNQQYNENYAREIMQLFSIGVVELTDRGETDGTATYDQGTVVELTRALTGWQLELPFAQYLGTNIPNYKDPLRAVPARHDTGQKNLFGQIIPAGQTVDQDLNSAIDILFNHHNVGPFIGKALIQMMVTSNPSPQYVANVTQAFNSPPRGDMKAVIRAILLDPEALLSPGPNFGKLREPVLAITNLFRNVNSYSTDYALSDLSLIGPNPATPFNTAYLAQSEDVFNAPTVFNFFPPNFSVPGASDLVGPEFGILSTTTSLGRMNLFKRFIFEGLGTQGVYRPSGTQLDTSALPQDPSDLVEACNQRFVHGSMSVEMRNIIVNAVTPLSGDQRVKEAVFLVTTSPAYQVQR